MRRRINLTALLWTIVTLAFTFTPLLITWIVADMMIGNNIGPIHIRILEVFQEGTLLFLSFTVAGGAYSAYLFNDASGFPALTKSVSHVGFIVISGALLFIYPYFLLPTVIESHQGDSESIRIKVFDRTVLQWVCLTLFFFVVIYSFAVRRALIKYRR